jgi:hypothetical protein
MWCHETAATTKEPSRVSMAWLMDAPASDPLADIHWVHSNSNWFNAPLALYLPP